MIDSTFGADKTGAISDKAGTLIGNYKAPFGARHIPLLEN